MVEVEVKFYACIQWKTATRLTYRIILDEAGRSFGLN